jgi:hypothetical protein
MRKPKRVGAHIFTPCSGKSHTRGNSGLFDRFI